MISFSALANAVGSGVYFLTSLLYKKKLGYLALLARHFGGSTFQQVIFEFFFSKIILLPRKANTGEMSFASNVCPSVDAALKPSMPEIQDWSHQLATNVSDAKRISIHFILTISHSKSVST